MQTDSRKWDYRRQNPLSTNVKPWAGAAWKREYGDPGTQPDMLRALSPIHKLERVGAPTLVLHGANDELVPNAEVERLVESLRRRDVPVEHVLFTGEGRRIHKTTNRVRAIVELVRWFERLRQ